jgi:hypothetical protein
LIFNLNITILNIYTVLILFLYYNTSTFGCELGIFLYDLALRVDINTLGLTSLYWLWTNTYYLYTLFALFLLVNVLSIHSIAKGFKTLVLMIYLYILCAEICYNLSLSQVLQLTDSSMGFYNLLLNNSINKVHPMLVYVSWLFPVLFYKNYILRFSLLHRTFIATSNMAIIMYFTLFLGGWWAYQEGSWGGWWNWDPSEMFGIIILGVLLTISHSAIGYNFTHYVFYRNLLFMLFTYYSFLQLNFSLISHNFGIRQGDLVDFRILYIFTFFLLLLSIFYKIQFYQLLLAFKSKSSIVFMFSAVLLWAIINLVVYASTIELWTSLMWNILRLDLQQSVVDINILNLLVLSLLFLSYANFSYYVCLLAIFAFYTPLLAVTPLLVIYIFKTKYSIYKNLHYLFLITLFTLTFYSSYSSVHCFNNFNNSRTDSISLNLPLAHYVCTQNYSAISTFTAVSSSLALNSTEVKPFILVNHPYSTLQCYFISLVDIVINSVAIDYYNNLILAFTLVFFSLYYVYSQYLLIIKF